MLFYQELQKKLVCGAEVEFESKDGKTKVLDIIEEAMKRFNPSIAPSHDNKYKRFSEVIFAQNRKDVKPDTRKDSCR